MSAALSHSPRQPMPPPTNGSKKQAFVLRWRRFVLDSDLPSTTRLVLLTLSVYMDDDGGSCYPTTATIAKDTGLSQRSVCTHIEKAEEEGWLEKVSAGKSGQGWKRNGYLARAPKALKEVQCVEPEGTEPDAEGTEPHDTKALKEVQSNSPRNSPRELEEVVDGAREDFGEGERLAFLPDEYAVYAPTVTDLLERYTPESLPELVRNQWGQSAGALPLPTLRSLYVAEVDAGRDALARVAAAVVITANHANRPNPSYLQKVLNGFNDARPDRKRSRTKKGRRPQGVADAPAPRSASGDDLDALVSR